MRGFAAFLVVSVALGLASCSLAVSTDGFTSRPNGDGSTDASVEGTTIRGDGGGSLVTPKDAEPDSTGSFCAAHPGATFCEDFQRGMGDWTSSVSNDGTLLLGEGFSSSAGLSTMLSAMPTGEASARVYRDFPMVPKSLHAEIDMKLCSASAGSREVLKIEFPNPFDDSSPGYLSSAIEVTSSGNHAHVVIEGFTSATTPFADPYDAAIDFPRDTWTHIVVDAVLSTSGSIKLTVNGALVINATGIRTLTTGASASRLVVGSYTYELTSACTQAFDNVLLQLTP